MSFLWPLIIITIFTCMYCFMGPDARISALGKDMFRTVLLFCAFNNPCYCRISIWSSSPVHRDRWTEPVRGDSPPSPHPVASPLGYVEWTNFYVFAEADKKYTQKGNCPLSPWAEWTLEGGQAGFGRSSSHATDKLKVEILQYHLETLLYHRYSTFMYVPFFWQKGERKGLRQNFSIDLTYMSHLVNMDDP